MPTPEDIVINPPTIPTEYSKMVSDMIQEHNKPTCDVECLKNKWLNSKQEYESLPEIINNNEKNYYVEFKGETYYRDTILKNKYTEHINNYNKKELDKFNNIKKVTDTILQDYTVSFNTHSRLTEIRSSLLKQNNDLKNKIDNLVKKVSTDERKVYYENQNVTDQNLYQKIIIWIYYSLLVLYILFGSFFKNYNYRNYKIWLVIILYIAIPYLLSYIINLFYSLYSVYSSSSSSSSS